MNFKQYEKYMPSEKFIKIFASIAGVIILFLIVTSHFGNSSDFNNDKSALTENSTVGDLVTLDSNDNGIPDWEESLWGLDPKADGALNKSIITQKKVQNGLVDTGAGQNDAKLTQTDIFARQFLSTILALKQSGGLTTDAVTKLTDSMTKGLDQKRDTNTYYTADGITTVPDSDGAKKAFGLNLLKLIQGYSSQGMGSELPLISNALNGQSEQMPDLEPEASAYENFAKDLSTSNTPISMAQYIAQMANSSVKMANGLRAGQNIYTDAVGGMVGIDDYMQAKDQFDKATTNLAQFLSPSGTLPTN